MIVISSLFSFLHVVPLHYDACLLLLLLSRSCICVMLSAIRVFVALFSGLAFHGAALVWRSVLACMINIE
jgi:hypothetical protein